MDIYQQIINRSPTTPCTVEYIKSFEFLINAIKNIEGNVVELGVFKGTNSLIIGELLKYKKSDKSYIGIDTFEGYTETDLQASKVNVSEDNYKALKKIQDSNRWSYEVEKVRTLLSGLNCEVIKGDINNIVPKLNHKVSLLYVDCNVFLPAYNAMKYLSKNMDKGSLIVIDEHIAGGETEALQRFANEYDYEIIKTGHKYPNGFPMYLKIK